MYELKLKLENEPKVIYMKPDAEDDVSWFSKLSNEEKLHVANNGNDYEIYSLKDFETAFNEELISDLGFIFIV